VLDGAYKLLKMRSSHETVVKIMTRLEAAAITILSVTDEITEAAKALLFPAHKKAGPTFRSLPSFGSPADL
jgi:hypothetical protein